jgi:prephenate dehydratase
MHAGGRDQEGGPCEGGSVGAWEAGAAKRRPRVGFLGPAGTFTEEALLSSARADSVEPVALATIYDTVLAVRAGTVRWAVVPIEN